MINKKPENSKQKLLKYILKLDGHYLVEHRNKQQPYYLIIGTLTLVFIVLKLCAIVDWDWIWVFTPFWTLGYLLIMPFLVIRICVSEKYLEKLIPYQLVIGLLTIIFVILKLCVIVDWDWIWVLVPFWGNIFLFIFLGIILNPTPRRQD